MKRQRVKQAALNEAGVDYVAMVGDGFGVVGGEEESKAGNFIRLIWPLRAWRLEINARSPVCTRAASGARWRWRREDRVDADVSGGRVRGPGVGESHDGGLRGDVHGHVGVGNDPANRTHVDDGAAAGSTHGWEHRLDHEEMGTEVRAMDWSHFSGSLLQWCGAGRCCVVDEDVDGTVHGEDLIDGFLRRRGL